MPEWPLSQLQNHWSEACGSGRFRINQQSPSSRCRRPCRCRRLAGQLACPSLSIGELRAASCSWTLLEAGDPSWVESRRDDGLAFVASYGPSATLSPVRFASHT